MAAGLPRVGRAPGLERHCGLGDLAHDRFNTMIVLN